jgi:molybdenum cofactor guanylyltransferase
MNLILRSCRERARRQAVSPGSAEPIGVILAGGRGRRLGGEKAVVELGGRALITYPLAAMSAVLSDVAVIAKPDTQLPRLAGVSEWTEPVSPRHPLVGIIEGLARAHRRPVLVGAVDLPFVTPELLRRLASADPDGSPGVIAADKGEMQPLLGCYRQSARRLLGRVGDGVALRQAVARIGPQLLEVGDPQALFNVNTREDLLEAEAILERRGRAASRT